MSDLVFYALLGGGGLFAVAVAVWLFGRDRVAGWIEAVWQSRRGK